MQVILASGSPRRQELLKYAVKDFEIITADIDEVIPDGVAAEDAPEYLAVRKAQAVYSAHPDSAVIGCDTVVIIDGKILGKPKDKDDAKEMLRMLSGKTHKVITGVCVFFNGKSASFSEETSVDFYDLSEEDIAEYVGTGDPMDKAGAYGIQSEGCVLVKGIRGDFFNVVGLPTARLKRFLRQLGII